MLATTKSLKYIIWSNLYKEGLMSSETNFKKDIFNHKKISKKTKKIIRFGPKIVP